MKLITMLPFLLTLPLSAAMAAPAPAQCDDTARLRNQQNTFIVTGTHYRGPVKSVSTTSYRSMGLILWVKEKVRLDPCGTLTLYESEYREMALEEDQVPLTQAVMLTPGKPDEATITLTNAAGDTSQSTVIKQHYTRDESGRIAQLTEDNELKPEGDKWQSETQYRYHEERLASEKETEEGETKLTIYKYDDDGRIMSKEQPNIMTEEYSYNAENQLTNVLQTIPTFWGKSTYSFTCFRWDKYGNCELQTMIKGIQLQDSAAVQSSGITLESYYEYY